MGFIWSGRKDGVHRQRVGIIMNKASAKSCLNLEGINSIVLVTHFTPKKGRVSVSICLCRTD